MAMIRILIQLLAEKAGDDIQEIDQLNSQLKETEITNKYYTVIRDDDINFRIELFSAGESVLNSYLITIKNLVYIKQIG